MAMKQIRPLVTALFVTSFGALPLSAQEVEEEQGRSLMEEGARLFLEGIQREMGPALEDLRGMTEEMEPALRQFVEEMGPALSELMGKVGDLSAYHAPEVLPNGDIIIRRKTPQEIEPTPEGEIEL